MKYYFLYIFFFLALANVNGQKQETIYNTKINKADKVEIKNGEITINRADTVIIKVTITDSKYRVYVDAFNQSKDSLGYLTYIHFINPNLLNYEVDLIFKFDKSIIDGILEFESGAAQINNMIFSDKKMWSAAGKITTPNGFYALIKSKEKIQVSITGVYGVLKK